MRPVEVLGTPADPDEVVATFPTDGRPCSEIEELLAGSHGIPADRVTDEPTECGGQGEIIGGWT